MSAIGDFTKQIFDSTVEYIDRIALGIADRLDELDARLKVIPAGPQGEKGAPGETGPAGKDGADADPVIVRSMVTEAVAAMPRPADGADGKEGPPGPQGEKGDPGPAGADGRDVDLLTVTKMVGDAVARVAATIPVPADGKEGPPGPAGEPGPPGQDAETDFAAAMAKAFISGAEDATT